MNSQKGFTLIELMITVAIIGILTAIAMPAYTNYVTRGRVPEATANLATKRMAMEQAYLDNRVYGGAGSPCTNTTTVDSTSSPKYFDFQCTVLTNTTYTIKATGKGGMAGFSYTLDQSNAKTSAIVAPAPTDWIANSNSCWIINMGGAC